MSSGQLARRLARLEAALPGEDPIPLAESKRMDQLFLLASDGALRAFQEATGSKEGNAVLDKLSIPELDRIVAGDRSFLTDAQRAALVSSPKGSWRRGLEILEADVAAGGRAARP